MARNKSNRRRGSGPPSQRSRSRSPRGRARQSSRDWSHNQYQDHYQNQNGLPPRPQQPPAPSYSMPPPPGLGPGPGLGPRTNGSDNYRPAPPPPPGRDFRPDSYDTYNQYSRYDRGPPPPPPPPSSYPPPPPSRSNSYSQQSNLDSYRPGNRPPQGDFTFRVPPPSGIDTLPPPLGSRDNLNSYGRRGGNRNSNRGARRAYPYPRVAVSERPILAANKNGQPAVLLRDNEEGVTYKAFDQLSDDEEHDMSISGESDSNEDAEPAVKRARKDATKAEIEEAAAAPKWSNPDVTTAIATEASADRRNTDMVQLIRRARVEAAAANNALNTELDDVISFGSDSEKDTTQTTFAPKPISSRLPPPPSFPPPAPPPAPALTPPGSHSRQRDSDPLGSRKRTADDQIKTYGGTSRQPTDMEWQKKLIRMVEDWQVVDGVDPCPWTKDHSETPDIAYWLHKEVVDFYCFSRPREFEQVMRRDLVGNLRRALRRSAVFREREVRAFGSFTSGLYLPTADMDLVVCSDQILRGLGEDAGMKTKKLLFKFRSFLLTNGLPQRGNQPEVITGAKVPLVKYVDRVTKLKVDVSFENISGISAIDTFLAWKEKYPAMPVLVTVIKQFLAMRGYNEPVNGGIGSFTVICLVVSMFQMMPQLQSSTMTGEHNLGELLVEFLDLYGNKFEYKTVAIRLKPPGYIPKHQARSLTYKNMDRLSIIDPNNDSNDISGGSRNFCLIKEIFSYALTLLKERMAELASLPPEKRANESILEPILGGNYECFIDQRRVLYKLHKKTYGPCDDSFAHSHAGV